MTYPEILAPAGSKEALVAALRCGADAVYGGGKLFSARHSAENFDEDGLAEAVALCHLYGAKFYLTVNTLILDEEFPALAALVQDAVDAGVDAFLVQDFGVLSFLRQMAPDTPIHASTQMTIHTPAGARWAKEQGIRRVVVSRELSRQEIAAICRCGVEVEQFVHGALCMSVSGQCGLSAVIGSRSANRGRCAQACRLPFSATGKQDYCGLSLKDLCLVPYVRQMAEDGVCSLKIEGRCKRPEYVAAAVTALRQARDGQEPDLHTLQAVFSRSGFTDGYYTGLRQNMFGTRQKEDVLQAKEVLPKLSSLYQKPVGFVPLELKVNLTAGSPVTLTAQDHQGNTVAVTGEVPQPAKTRPTDTQQLEKQLGKLGGTIYTLDHLAAKCDGVSMLPASSLNALRRTCVEAMDAKRIHANTPPQTLGSIPALESVPAPKSAPTFHMLLSQWRSDCEALLRQNAVAAIWLPLSEMGSVPAKYRSQVRLTLPRFCAKEEKLAGMLEQAKHLGYTGIVCENAAHLRLGADYSFLRYGGMGLNAANCYALQFLRSLGVQDILLSPELTAAQSRRCQGLPIGLYVYGNQPVMTMRQCPVREEVGCKRCTHQLVDRTGRQFPLYCQKLYDCVTLYNALPTWMADRLDSLSHAAYWLLDCTLSDDPTAILDAYQNRRPSQGPMTRGLYQRGVQ